MTTTAAKKISVKLGALLILARNVSGSRVVPETTYVEVYDVDNQGDRLDEGGSKGL